MNHRATIALLTSSEGHFSLSEAIRQSLESQYHVEVYKQNILMRHLYLLAYRYFPQAFHYPYKLSQKPEVNQTARKLYAFRYGKRIAAFLNRVQPRFIISTYFMYLDILEKYHLQTGTKFLNIISNPETIHPIELSKTATANTFFQEWGWFVRAEYEQAYDKNQVQHQLGLEPSRLTILLAGGSEGNQKIMWLLPMLLKHPQPLNLIIVNGSNATMKAMVDTMIKRFKTANKQIINLGFTTELHRYLQAADLVVGKAGPNLLFEAVATHTPFLAVSHISGQEDGNLDIIKRHQLGIVEENKTAAAQVLNQIIDQPTRLDQYQPGLQQLAAHNRQAKDKLLAHLEQHLAL